ncbi:MAG: hypothetical protein ACR2F8_04075 [Caulobacteraceae bacterium]
MTAQPLPPPPFGLPMTDRKGGLTRAWRAFFTGLYNRAGGTVDKIDAAHALATAAVPQGTQVIATGGLQVGGPLGGNVGVALYAAVTSVALLPASANLGDWAFALDGRKAGEGAGAGSGTPAWWDGANWIAPDSGAAVAA